MNVCDHGNCWEEDTHIVISSKRHGIRRRFCSYKHAELECKEASAMHDEGEVNCGCRMCNGAQRSSPLKDESVRENKDD